MFIIINILIFCYHVITVFRYKLKPTDPDIFPMLYILFIISFCEVYLYYDFTKSC